MSRRAAEKRPPGTLPGNPAGSPLHLGQMQDSADLRAPRLRKLEDGEICWLHARCLMTDEFMRDDFHSSGYTA